MKGCAPASIAITDVYKGIIPFVLLQIIGLLLVIALPDIALWLPNTILD